MGKSYFTFEDWKQQSKKNRQLIDQKLVQAKNTIKSATDVLRIVPIAGGPADALIDFGADLIIPALRAMNYVAAPIGTLTGGFTRSAILQGRDVFKDTASQLPKQTGSINTRKDMVKSSPVVPGKYKSTPKVANPKKPAKPNVPPVTPPPGQKPSQPSNPKPGGTHKGVQEG